MPKNIQANRKPLKEFPLISKHAEGLKVTYTCCTNYVFRIPPKLVNKALPSLLFLIGENLTSVNW